MTTTRKRYSLRYREMYGECILVVDTKERKVVDSFSGWDAGHPAAYDLCKRLNDEDSKDE